MDEARLRRSALETALERTQQKKTRLEDALEQMRQAETLISADFNSARDERFKMPGERVFVVTYLRTSHVVHIFAGMTVDELKTRIRALSGIEKDAQRLLCAGRQLGDWETLESTSVKHESTIHCVQRLRGY